MVEMLIEYFSKYGAVTECVIMKDKETGKSRGFGFVSFDSEEAVELVLANSKSHVLLGKWIDCKKATAKSTPRHAPYQPRAPYPVRLSAYGQSSMYPSQSAAFNPTYGYELPPQPYYQPPIPPGASSYYAQGTFYSVID